MALTRQLRAVPLVTMAVGTACTYWLWRSRAAVATGTRNPTGLGPGHVPFDSRVDDAGPEYDQRPVRPYNGRPN